MGVSERGGTRGGGRYEILVFGIVSAGTGKVFGGKSDCMRECGVVVVAWCGGYVGCSSRGEAVVGGVYYR